MGSSITSRVSITVSMMFTNASTVLTNVSIVVMVSLSHPGQLVDVDQVGQPVHGLLVHELDVLLWELGLRRLSCKEKLDGDDDTFFLLRKLLD